MERFEGAGNAAVVSIALASGVGEAGLLIEGSMLFGPKLAVYMYSAGHLEQALAKCSRDFTKGSRSRLLFEYR